MSKFIPLPGDITITGMTATRTYTEREKVLAEREAFAHGFRNAETVRGCEQSIVASQARAAKFYPLPKVTRPRRAVLHTPAGKMIAFVKDGRLFDGPTEEPIRQVDPLWLGPDGLRDLADLLANQTEEVDAE